MLNKVMFIGHLGQDPELHGTGEQARCKFSVASSEKWMGKDGNKQERTEWLRVTVWGKTAENCAKYLTKGKMVYVEGKLQTSSYDKDGQKHYSTECVARDVRFLSPAGGGGGPRDGAPGAGPEPEYNEEIPF